MQYDGLIARIWATETENKTRNATQVLSCHTKPWHTSFRSWIDSQSTSATLDPAFCLVASFLIEIRQNHYHRTLMEDIKNALCAKSFCFRLPFHVNDVTFHNNNSSTLDWIALNNTIFAYFFIPSLKYVKKIKAKKYYVRFIYLFITAKLYS